MAVSLLDRELIYGTHGNASNASPVPECPYRGNMGQEERRATRTKERKESLEDGHKVWQKG